MSAQMPQELRERLPHEPKLWVRNMLSHPNSPERQYDFYDSSGDNFLHFLVDDEGPMEPDNWGDVNVLLFARGSLKTFTCTSIMGWGTDTYPSIESVATAPVDDQRYEVIERFKEKAEQSGLAARRVKNKLSFQKFENNLTRNDGSDTTAYSTVKSRSAWGDGDKIRGIHAHLGVIDEAQDVDEGTFSTFMEAVDREIPQVDYFPTTFVIGTPKQTNTFFHRLWQMSDQQTWDAEKREWVQQSAAEEFLPRDMQQERDELEERLQRLPEDVDDEARDRLQQRINDIQGFTVRGWHVDQHNSPLHDETDIAYKRETYSKKKFENEVNANFYTPEHDLLSNDDVWDAFDDTLTFTPTRRFEESNCYLTVDWGGGQGEGAAKTVATVAEVYEDHMYVDAIRPFESGLSLQEECSRIDTLMADYDVDMGIVDEGFGDTKRETLQDEYGYDANSEQPIYGCWFGNVTTKEDVTWNRHNDEKRFFTAAKTFCVKQLVNWFKDNKVTIPQSGLSFDTKGSRGTQILDHLTAPYTERRETQSGRTKVVVKSDRNDDIFDTFIYVWIADQLIETSSRTLHTAGAVQRRGR